MLDSYLICIMRYDANKYESVRLTEVATIAPGYPFRGSIDSTPNGDVAVVQMRNIDDGYRVEWGEVARTKLTGRRCPDWLQQRDVLFSARGTRNIAAVVDGVPGHAVCSPLFFLVRVKAPDRLLPEVVAWQINQEPLQRYLSASATGSNITSIRRQVLEDLPIVVAPIARQQAVVDFNEAALQERRLLSNLIDNRNRQMQALADAICGDILGRLPQ